MRVEHEVPDERVESLLTCAFEGGTGYWARIWKVEGPGSRQTGGYAIAPLRGGRSFAVRWNDARAALAFLEAQGYQHDDGEPRFALVALVDNGGT